MNSGSTVTTGASTTLNLKKQKSNEGEDVISNLPEPIISHILSCLSFRDALRTCVLSKAWICRWICVTKLKLDDIDPFFHVSRKGKKRFVDLVNKTLLLLANNPRVESFHLILSSDRYGPSLVNRWISSILNRDVKNLNVRSYSDHNFSVASSHLLFNAYYLEGLVLNFHRCAIRVPSSYVSFTRLEFLELICITFTLDFPSESKELSLDFPILREFKTIDCKWLGVKCVTLKVPLLEKFCTRGYLEESNNCAINIYTSQLTEFTYEGHISHDVVLKNPSSANGVVVNFSLSFCARTYGQEVVRACKLIKQFSQAKCLKLAGIRRREESKILITSLSQFGMLSNLKLVACTCEVLLGLLHKSPFLKTLDIQEIIIVKEILNSAVVPNCVLSTLEVVKYERFYKSELELALAKFLLVNALVLKKMSISEFGFRHCPEEASEFKEKLISFKKGSSLAILEFYPRSRN